MKPILYKWAVCQHLSTAEQLNRGVRYFDFRLAKVAEKKKSAKRNAKVDYYSEEDSGNPDQNRAKDIKILHALVGAGVAGFVREIDEFLRYVPGPGWALIRLQFSSQTSFSKEQSAVAMRAKAC